MCALKSESWAENSSQRSHFVNQASNQRPSFTKVVQFGMLFENVKVKLSFVQKSPISSISKRSIKAEKTSFTNVAQFGMPLEKMT